MKLLKLIATAAITFVSILASSGAKAEWPPEAVVEGVYAGIQQIHGYKATPRLVLPLPRGTSTTCGSFLSSHYCKLDHTVYITNHDIEMAYQHGDAALAYIIAHEYAHAMQTAYGFEPGVTLITELQADCLAGVYLGVIPNIIFDEKDIVEITSFAYRIGDYAWGSEHHHGTPEQRVQAVMLGFQGALEGRGVETCIIELTH
ncbi:MAG: neutral zinc metallopeptidase [Xenococcaceae cyanobacterium]